MPATGIVVVDLIGRAWANLFSRAGWSVECWDEIRIGRRLDAETRVIRLPDAPACGGRPLSVPHQGELRAIRAHRERMRFVDALTWSTDVPFRLLLDWVSAVCAKATLDLKFTSTRG
jgi:hypothetical protein